MFARSPSFSPLLRSVPKVEAIPADTAASDALADHDKRLQREKGGSSSSTLREKQRYSGKVL